MTMTIMPLLRRLIAVMALIALAACSYPESTRTLAETDHRARFPIGVKSEVVEVVFRGDSGAAMTPAERDILRQFVAAYIDRGQKPLTILMGGAGQSRQALAEGIRETAIAQGLARSEVLLGIDPAQSGEVVTASFISYTAIVPECGYWHQESYANATNVNSANFGCATQRNLGLMVADPSDLLAPTPFDPRDGPRTAIVIDLYRRGELTQAEWPESGTSTSDVVD
jgi:pilus assembly protein CpaD